MCVDENKMIIWEYDSYIRSCVGVVQIMCEVELAYRVVGDYHMSCVNVQAALST